MNRQLIEIENALPSTWADLIEYIFLGLEPENGKKLPLYPPGVPWQYINDVTYPSNKREFKNSAFNFLIKQNDYINREFYPLLSSIPIFIADKAGLNIDSIIQIRGFLHPPSNISSKNTIHVDIVDRAHTVILYYVNDSDGDTVLFEDDAKTEFRRVTPKKNKAIVFDGSIPHCSSKPCSGPRCVINSNITTI